MESSLYHLCTQKYTSLWIVVVDVFKQFLPVMRNGW